MVTFGSTKENLHENRQALQQRNQMVVQYLPLVRTIAADVCAATSANVEYDDLVSVGVFGLIDSVNSFDTERNVKFSTYCKRRIRGSMLDELRNLDWVPRWTRQKNNLLRKAESYLSAKLERKPTNAEVADELGLDQNELKKMRKTANLKSMFSFDSITDSGDSEDSNVDIEDCYASDPISEVQKKDAKEFITKSLTPMEKMVITLYYYEELTMQEIGQTLNISESRVSQIHSQILERMRSRIYNDEEKFLASV